jgi:ActR/RegA family two-component response regulator
MTEAMNIPQVPSRPAVLIVEDNFLVGVMIASLVRKMGYQVVGPVPSVDKGLHAARSMELAGAVLDINIRGGTSEDIALELESRGVPFFFVTGYASPLLISEKLKATLRLSKPVNEGEFKTAVGSRFLGITGRGA